VLVVLARQKSYPYAARNTSTAESAMRVLAPELRRFVSAGQATRL
jgi:hypothetical protein